MPEIRITGLSMCESEADRERGMVARFACVIGPVRVTGCVLKFDALGRLQAILPRCRRHSGSIRFADRSQHPELTKAARAAFLALGGVLPVDDSE